MHQYNLSSTRAGLIYRFHSGLRSSHAKLQKLSFPVVFTIPQWIWGNWLGKGGANKRRITVTPFLPPSSPPTSPDLGTVGDGFSLKWLTDSPSSAYRCSPQPHHAPPTPHPPSASIDAYLVWFGSTRMSILKSSLISKMDQGSRNEIACITRLLNKHNRSTARLIHPERVRTGRWNGNPLKHPAAYWQPHLLQQLQRPPLYPTTQMETLQPGNKMEYDEYPLEEESNLSNLQETTETNKQPGPMTLPSIKLPSISMPTLVPRRGLLVIRWI